MVMHIVAANKEDLMNRLSRFVACSVFVALPAFAFAQGIPISYELLYEETPLTWISER